MASSKLSLESFTPRAQPPAEKDVIVLQRAVEKLVLFGQQVGVSPEEMISLLNSGCGIDDLPAFLVSKNSGVS